MESMTYFGQKSNPFFLNLNPKEYNKDELNLKDKNKENEEKFLSSLSFQSKNEILALKKYIQKMNQQIRLQVKLELLPSMEEKLIEYSKKIKDEKELNEKCYESLNTWLDKILNVDYIDPLVNLYDKYIKSLEEELRNSKKMNKKYENTITKLVNENNDLRSQLLVNEEEMKNFLGVRNGGGDGSNILVPDRDYILKIEERNQLLSKENELLFINYNKIQNELMQIKRGNNYIDKTENDIKYNKLYQLYLETERKYKELQIQYNDIYNKLADCEKNFYALQNQNDKILNENKTMRQSFVAIDQKLNYNL